MVSFHTPLSPTRRTMIQECHQDSSKKRKWEVSKEIPKSHSSKPKYTKSVFETELHLESPLPLDWQRCLDIKCGQIYYFNTRTNKKTSWDPRSSPDPPTSPKHMSLDLELNLPCGSSVGKNPVADNFTKYNNSSTQYKKNSGGSGGGDGDQLLRCPTWLSLQGDQQQQEMVTAVCKKCHMLVMMFKSSPACPNCKFMHPPDQNPPGVFNRVGLSLLC